MQHLKTQIEKRAREGESRSGMVWIGGGTFTMGSDAHYPEEAPAHRVFVDGFWIDRQPVTNRDFSQFVQETKYVTVSERRPNAQDYPGAQPEMLVPASVVFRVPKSQVDVRNHYNWWTYVPGANWRHPEGPRTTLKGKARHPVVHIAYEDAAAYAAWAAKNLPTEAEWEFAARGGLEGAEFAWGNDFMPEGRAMANTWQGEFPYFNHDGNATTSPVGSFPPNGYGLVDMIGNVWEWTSDWYADKHGAAPSCCDGLRNPSGGKRETSYDPSMPDIRIARKVMKGGSFLCAPNYCRRYRPAARMAQAVDTATCHLGFRCIVRRQAPD
ncbi:MAG TPA: formylglycine-generating enzyme family protein [Rhizomicrobium sp.]|nr:formylglycine-generating enzyme family protein [Rhizomicrobium sp.]